ncbi:MAG TPA: DUF5317 family protein [Acidimicrobiales bacterium]|nr:DUF5317 family protein [Acidimicrobiales bacterium]
MRVALVALVGGLVLGLAAGGRPANAARARLRWPSLAVVAVILAWAPRLLEATASAAAVLVLCSLLALLAFALANLRLVGMAVVAVGLAANATVIAANEGMPVDPQAVIAAGLAEPGDAILIELGTAQRWQDGDDRLVVLGDIVPVSAVGEVASFGDLVLAAGLADVAYRLLRPRHASHRPTRGSRAHVAVGGS